MKRKQISLVNLLILVTFVFCLTGCGCVDLDPGTTGILPPNTVTGSHTYDGLTFDFAGTVIQRPGYLEFQVGSVEIDFSALPNPVKQVVLTMVYNGGTAHLASDVGVPMDEVAIAGAIGVGPPPEQIALNAGPGQGITKVTLKGQEINLHRVCYKD